MAKDILFKVEVETSKAVENLAEYQKKIAEIDDEIKNLRKQMKEEGADTKKLGGEIAKLTQERKAYNTEISTTSRQIQSNLIATSEKYQDTLKGMRARLSEAKEALSALTLGTQEYADQAAEVKRLNDEVKGLEQQYGVFTRSVGDYETAIKNALASTSPMAATIAHLAQEAGNASTMLGNVGTALNNVGKAGLALLANPVFLMLSGLAAVFLAIKKGINSSEEATARWNAVLAPLNRALDWMLNVAQKAAGAILSGVETASKGIDWLMGKLEHLPLIGDKIAEINKANKEAIQLEKDTYELTKRTREDEVANAKAALDVAKLRTQAKDKERYTAAERLKFVQQAAAIEDEIAKRNVEREKEKLRIMEAEASRAQNNTGTEDALAQQRASVYRAEMDYYNKTRELLEQETTARNEMAAEAKAALDKVYQKESKMLNLHQQLAKSKAEYDAIYFYDYSKSAEENAELQFQHEQIWAARSFQFQQQMEKEKLSLQLKYNKISQEQYNAQMQLLADAEAQFQLEQLADLEAHTREAMSKVIELAGGLSVKEQLRQLEEEYERAFQTLENDAKMSADERAYYEIKLTDELVKKRNEIIAAGEQQITDTIKEETEKRENLMAEYGDAVRELLYSLNDVFNAFSDAERQRAEENNEAQKESLKKRLDAGVISQKKYDKEVEKLDKQLAEEKAQIAYEEAVREKALAVADIAWSTAQAIMNIWANMPPFAAPALTAIASAIGAAQTAAVLATPIPKARKGGRIIGATHEQGGVLVNTENEERIISANPAKAFPELLNLISYIGKHAQIPNTGYAARSMMDSGGSGMGGSMNADVLAEKIGEQVADAVRQMPIYLSLTELKREQDMMARIENSAKM